MRSSLERSLLPRGNSQLCAARGAASETRIAPIFNHLILKLAKLVDAHIITPAIPPHPLGVAGRPRGARPAFNASLRNLDCGGLRGLREYCIRTFRLLESVLACLRKHQPIARIRTPAAARFNNSLRGLSSFIKLPMPPRVFVRRVQDRVIKKWVRHLRLGQRDEGRQAATALLSHGAQ